MLNGNNLLFQAYILEEPISQYVSSYFLSYTFLKRIKKHVHQLFFGSNQEFTQKQSIFVDQYPWPGHQYVYLPARNKNDFRDVQLRSFSC